MAPAFTAWLAQHGVRVTSSLYGGATRLRWVTHLDVGRMNADVTAALLDCVVASRCQAVAHHNLNGGVGPFQSRFHRRCRCPHPHHGAACLDGGVQVAVMPRDRVSKCSRPGRPRSHLVKQ